MGPFGLSAGVARWVARVLVWLSLAAAIVLRFADPEPLPTFRNAFFDFAQRLLPPADDTPQAPLTIVEIDEPSLARLGQWPWPRDLLADLVREIGRHEPRSEEHTSELQSLMRISYAVFCLKKKTDNHNICTHTIQIY